MYFDSFELTGFTEALNLAIDEFYRPIYVENPISDRNYLSNFSENIDLNSVFTESEGNPMTFSVINNTDPGLVSAEVNGNILTISGLVGDMSESSVTVQAVSGENSATDEFKVIAYDPTSFTYLEQSFESDFPPPFWEIKYNTAADGGLNGANLIDPLSGEETWFKNTLTTQNYGSDYIHSGDNSALIKYWAPEFNWFISQPMELDQNDYQLLFWIWFNSSSYPTVFHVLIDDGTKGWTSILDYDGDTPDNMYESIISLSLADYAGKIVRIAFVYEYSDGFEIAIDDIQVWSPTVTPDGIAEHITIPSEIILYQNYPNPFNPETRISFSIPEKTELNLSVYNIKGEQVKILFDGIIDKGIHNVNFNASDLTTGIYYYKLETQAGIISKKMIMLK